MRLTCALVIGLVAIATPLSIRAENGTAKETIFRANPTLPSNAPASASEVRREAVRKYLQGMCDLHDAMKEFSETSNESIEHAILQFRQATDGFYQVAKMISKEDTALSVPADNKDVANAQSALEAEGFEGPPSYEAAFAILGEQSTRAAKELSEIRYMGSGNFNIRVLVRLRDVSAQAANVFVAVSTLTALGSILKRT